LAEQGYGEDLLADFTAALAVTHDCRARGISGKGYWLGEVEASKVDMLLDLHEQQMGLAKKADLAAAITKSYKHAG
jgi:hypothetical protein